MGIEQLSPSSSQQTASLPSLHSLGDIPVILLRPEASGTSILHLHCPISVDLITRRLPHGLYIQDWRVWGDHSSKYGVLLFSCFKVYLRLRHNISLNIWFTAPSQHNFTACTSRQASCPIPSLRRVGLGSLEKDPVYERARWPLMFPIMDMVTSTCAFCLYMADGQRGMAWSESSRMGLIRGTYIKSMQDGENRTLSPQHPTKNQTKNKGSLF